jgi:hypothetical protein
MSHGTEVFTAQACVQHSNAVLSHSPLQMLCAVYTYLSALPDVVTYLISRGLPCEEAPPEVWA